MFIIGWSKIISSNIHLEWCSKPQSDFTNTVKWSKENGMIINVNRVETNRDLWVKFQSKLKYPQHCDEIVFKANGSQWQFFAEPDKIYNFVCFLYLEMLY